MARPKSPIISREVVARASLELIDADGLDAFSLDRLAKLIGIRAPSLYHHFTDKADILSSVARHIMLQADIPAEPTDGDWVEYMVDQAIEFRRTIVRHPNAARLLLEHLPRRMMISAYERQARLLERNGVPTELHMLLFEGVDKLTLGSALAAASQSPGGDDTSLFPGIDAERDPLLVAVVQTNPWDDETLFAEAVRSFLRGALEAKPPARRRRGAARKDA